MTYEEAASFPIPHLTGVQALYIRLNIPKPLSPNPKRESILIWGGSTAVGHHAIQLAVLSGLKVFVTASPAAHEELKALGVEACFDYKDSDVVKQIQAAAGEEDIIYGLDTVGEKGSTDACVVGSRSNISFLCIEPIFQSRTLCLPPVEVRLSRLFRYPKRLRNAARMFTWNSPSFTLRLGLL